MKNALQQQFADEWKKVSAVVESEARRQLLTIGHLDYSMLNDVLRDELETWFKPSSARHLWLEQLDESGGYEKAKIAMRLRQVHLLDVYRVGEQCISTLRQKTLYLLLSIFVGLLVWLGTDIVFAPTVQEYFSSPLKWVAFPLLATILAYSFCRPSVSKYKNNKLNELASAVTNEMCGIGDSIIVRTL